MKQLLEALEVLLVKINAPLLYSLNEGLDGNNILDLERANGFELPSEIKELYKWKNGSNADYDPRIGGGFLFRSAILMPLTKAYAEYNYTISNQFDFYLDSYFPLFESLNEEFFVIDCDPESETFKMILSYQTKHVYLTAGAVPVYDSPQTMIESITRCFSEKAYYYTKINQFEVDYELEDEIKASLNPKARYLKSFNS
ncbi:SMI1/KNR4 family protein [Flavihumibacter solisilvae]|uniref:Knr4/Smi1-like domain-containing protein n=1 Tax=Flavihumibacter solisilvae TaxID=1349421 RepID=A0A0C1IVA7_9BACT|nr:SMI1/KNR4 family protein [Flavihumibacter solisilvae]KIC94444.1 hypothetical protein OI18_12635 [Flavihumibacter solisilvae]